MVESKQEPTINADDCDSIYFSMSKAMNIFVKKHELKFEEVDIIINRLKVEWDQKKMNMFFKYLLDTFQEDKPPTKLSDIYK